MNTHLQRYDLVAEDVAFRAQLPWTVPLEYLESFSCIRAGSNF